MENKKRMNLFPENKRGWIEIVEAFVAVLLVAGVILILLNKGYLGVTDISEKVYEAQLAILREIQTNDTLRADIINAAEPLPIEWENSRFPIKVKNKIIERTPNYLNCIGEICSINQSCSISQMQGKDIYSQAVVITSTLETVSYRKLNLFCWTK